jgi:hypothetical protein
MLSDVVEEYFQKLYTFRPEQLPDVAVLMAEFRETWGIADLIYSYARQLRPLMMKRKQLRKLLGKIDIDIKRSLKQKRFAYARRLQLKKKSVEEILNDLANTILSWRFGVMAPVRDFTKLVASCYTYWDRMKFCPTSEHIRRIMHFDYSEMGCIGEGSCGVACNSPFGVGRGDEVVSRESKHIVTLTASADFTNQFTGSTVEQIAWSLLSYFGAMPDITSIWEMTKLSWFVDYFVRLSHLMQKFSAHAGVGVFLNPIVHRTSVGLKIESETRDYDLHCPNTYTQFEYGIMRETYYERIAGLSPMQLTNLIRLVRSPSMNQGVNAIALLTQLLTSA